MIAKIVDVKTYIREAEQLKIIYNGVSFVEKNSYKVEKIIYIIIYKEASARFCVVFGVKDNRLYCPFSAPFGYIEPIKKHQSMNSYYSAVKAIERLFAEEGFSEIVIGLAPDFYDHNVINSWYNAMLMNGWSVMYVDLNFQIRLQENRHDYEKKLRPNARKNLKKAMKYNYKLFECESENDIRRAYYVIKANRVSKDYPLRMTEEQVVETMGIVPSKMYSVIYDDRFIAAALVYEVTRDVAQVIYWGDSPEYSNQGVMNYIAYELVRLYTERGFEYLDIGPSTENGVPNFGLCNFKDSIGCERTIKIKLHKLLDVNS